MQSSSRRPSATHLQALGRARDGESVSSPRSSSGDPSPRIQEAATDNRHFQLDVRSARVADLPALGAIERVYPLLQPQLILSGYTVSGSDLAPGDSTHRLEKLGARNRTQATLLYRELEIDASDQLRPG